MSDSEDSDNQVLFVFYKANTHFNLDFENTTSFTWTGSGGNPSKIFPNEIQYNGKKEDFIEFANIIGTAFQKLKKTRNY